MRIEGNDVHVLVQLVEVLPLAGNLLPELQQPGVAVVRYGIVAGECCGW